MISTDGGESTLCGKTAAVTWHGKTVNVRVVDECPGCGHDDIDLSPSAFEQLGDKGAFIFYPIYHETYSSLT